MSESDADWWCGDDCKNVLVVPPVQGIAIYKTKDGTIVIRQACEYGGEDSLVGFDPMFKQSIIDALEAIQ